MTLMALQGRALARAVDEVRRLLAHGEVPSTALRGMESLGAMGLWTACEDAIVATPMVVALADRLPSAGESVAAIFSLLPDVRAEWLRLVRARLAEMGERKDIVALADAVTAAGPLATELLKVERPSLSPASFNELERAVLPAAAHEASAFPVLLRVLAATATLRSGATSSELPDVAFDDPSTAWRPGRLLRLPVATDPVLAHSVLSGALDDSLGAGDPMRWVLQRPWAFLMAQIAFTKEAWEAERVAGGIALELEQAHLPLFQTPPRLEVVVTLPTGEEVRCGSLGEFVLQTLAQLGVSILGHRVTASVLDDHLGIVVEALLRHEVWRFDHGSGGCRPGYAIHSGFSDACYRALGSRAFYRLGSSITAAIRRVAETWAKEKVARAGATSSGGSAA